MRPIFTWRSERSLTVSQLNQGWFSQELWPEIKSTYQGLKRTAQPKKKMGWPYPRKWCWVTLVTPLMQGNANVNSVEPPLAPRKQRIKTTSQMQLMITTERHFFMKAKNIPEASTMKFSAKCMKQVPQSRGLDQLEFTPPLKRHRIQPTWIELKSV